MTQHETDSNAGPIPSSVSLAGTGDSGGVANFVVAKEPETKFAAWLDRISDFCSSILVKETRQAIKSRQFFFTFMLLLALVTVWSFIALSPSRDNYEIDSLGAFMLCGFLWILGLPLVLIIPYTTFRSLAQEYEDGTIDMVQITTMKPRQIIAGKLGSAMLQVLIYVSIIAPCISFSYLLRGVDISQIWLALGGGLIVNFGLCCLAIALASAANTRMIRQVLSVFLILGLLLCAWCWCALAMVICYEPIPFRQRNLVTLMMAGPALAWISSAILLFFAASAQIAFASSNRSTSLRICVFIQVLIFFGWFLGAAATFGFVEEAFMLASCFSMHYLLLVGSMMVGCHQGLSPRVRRTLPTSFMKRSLSALFYPGPGRAFLFTVGLAFGISAALAIVATLHGFFNIPFNLGGNGFQYRSDSFGSLEAGFCRMAILANLIYFLFFFCIMFLLSRIWARRSSATRKPFVIEMAIGSGLIVFIAMIGSYSVAPRLFWRTYDGMELSQIFNWYRVQYLAVEGNAEVFASLLLISIPTLAMMLIGIRLSAKELSIAGSVVPQRILDEEERMKRERIYGDDADEETIDEIFAAVRPDN